jgi:hypothetical protein
MKKSELKTGMWIETEAEEIGMILLNTQEGNMIVYDDNDFDYLSTWDDDLKYFNNNIIRVYDFNSSFKKGDLLWEREKSSVNNVTINITVSSDMDIKNIMKKINDELLKSIIKERATM